MTPAHFSTTEVNAVLDAAGPGAVVYLVGAGGCGVSGLGHLLLDLGFAVHGSDLIENAGLRQLRARGAVMHGGHAAEQVKDARPVLVAYSSAIRADNPEIDAARELGLPIVRRAVLLAALMHRRRGVCVAGMHGKTTTAAMLAFALEKLGARPSFAVGAAIPQFPAHARFVVDAPVDPAPPTSGLFVAEADESDGTLCEFRPRHAVVLNVDDEHLDYFLNVQNVCREFEQFAANAEGTLTYCADDARLAAMFVNRPKALSFGFSERAHYRAARVGDSATTGRTRFTVARDGVLLGEFSTRLIGDKNISNATAVIALLHQLGVAPEAIRAAIADFAGAARRQEELFANDAVRVFDDYGHHPNEIRATLRAFKQLNPRRLVVAFQPHRYTRTLRLMQQFACAFGDADLLFLADIYPASEPEIAGVNSVILGGLIRARGQKVEHVPELAGVAAAVRAVIQPGDLVLFLGAGDITNAAHQLADQLRMNGDATPRATGLAARLQALLSPDALFVCDEPLARRTTLRVGGRADYFIEPAGEDDLAALLRFCAQEQLPFTIIGRGSNLLIRDGGIRGVVISLGHEAFSRVQIVGDHLHCGAGAKLKTVSVEARRAGLAGLEFLEGIPGSVGGALRMNAGAMGSWMFEVVERVRFMDFNGAVHERRASEVNVEYRGCPLFKTHFALGAVLRGTAEPKEVIQERANAYNAKRWETQPPQPSAGCIFKNPKSIPAGKLIDELGLKGTRRGGAMISPVHGNFIVNEGGATAKDVLDLIQFVKETAKARRGIELETEVEILGE